jgi:hypothetical protein
VWPITMLQRRVTCVSNERKLTWDLALGVESLELEGSGLGFRVYGLGFRV